MLQDDWIIRQINDMVRFMVAVVFHKDARRMEFVEENKSSSGPNPLRKKLEKLVEEKKIGEADKLLQKSLDMKNKQNLQLAIDFYAKLNQLDDDALETGNFSRTAIQNGLIQAADRYGVPIASFFIDLN